MSEPIPAEFVGGPMDGQQRWLLPDQNSVEVLDCKQSALAELCLGRVRIVTRNYQRRQVNGIFVRLANGFYPYDIEETK
jgi:hypothetical protein